jgi:hypothetical protein
MDNQYGLPPREHLLQKKIKVFSHDISVKTLILIGIACLTIASIMIALIVCKFFNLQLNRQHFYSIKFISFSSDKGIQISFLSNEADKTLVVLDKMNQKVLTEELNKFGGMQELSNKVCTA